MSELHVILGTGAIGRAIMEELLQRGKSIRTVNRSGQMEEIQDGVEVVAADLFQPGRVEEVTSGAQVVYQAAQPAYHAWVEKFPSLQKSIIDGIARNKAKLVIAENLYMYGLTKGRPMTEDTAHNAHTRKGKVRSEMSKAALAAHQAGKIRLSIARGSDYFGPWGVNSTMGERVFYPLLEGKPAQATGRLDLPHTHTYTKDFGRAMVILGERDEADGQVWHVPNAMPDITQGELIQLFANDAGVEPKMRSMGKMMMWFGGLFVPAAKETLEMMYEFDQPFIVDSSKFEQTFGIKATPMSDAIKETVAWYTSHPQLKS